MFEFEHAEYLVLLWLTIPALGLLAVYYLWMRKRLGRLGSAMLIRSMIKGMGPVAKSAAGLFSVAAFALLFIALANPQKGAKPQKAKQVGLDIVLAIDISRSMQAQDIKPDRLAQAKRFSMSLLHGLAGNRVGVVIFAGNAYTQMPLTTDYSAADLYINSLTTDMAPTQGTAIGAAIRRSVDLFDASGAQPGEDKKTARAIIIVSDGENHDNKADEAAADAEKSGISIYTIGAGKPEGAPIPLYDNGERTGQQQDEAGNVVLSKLDENMLQKLADLSGGKYYNLAHQPDAADYLVKDLLKLSKEEKEVTVYSDYESQFQWFTGAAFLLLLAEYLLYLWPTGKRRFSHE